MSNNKTSSWFWIILILILFFFIVYSLWLVPKQIAFNKWCEKECLGLPNDVVFHLDYKLNAECYCINRTLVGRQLGK